jgi:hypothetical protein
MKRIAFIIIIISVSSLWGKRLYFDTGMSVGYAMTRSETAFTLTNKHGKQIKTDAIGFDVSMAYDYPFGIRGLLAGVRAFSAIDPDIFSSSSYFYTISSGIFVKIRY